MAETSNPDNSDVGMPGMPSTQREAPDDINAPPVRPWQINLLGVFLIIFTVITSYLIYAFWPTMENQNEWSKQTYLFCSTSCDSINCPDQYKKSKADTSNQETAAGTSVPEKTVPKNCSLCIVLTSEQRILILVLLAGALGSFIHAGTSFSNFVGQGKLEKSWIWWYLLRPIIGMSIALVFYLVFRGGLLNGTEVEKMNIYGILTMSALSGLFTDRATLKLEEIFQSIFQPKDSRKHKLSDQGGEIQDTDSANG